MRDRRYFAGLWHERLVAELASLARFPPIALDHEAAEGLESMGLVYRVRTIERWVGGRLEESHRFYLTGLGVSVLRAIGALPDGEAWRDPRDIDRAIEARLIERGVRLDPAARLDSQRIESDGWEDGLEVFRGSGSYTLTTKVPRG